MAITGNASFMNLSEGIDCYLSATDYLQLALARGNNSAFSKTPRKHDARASLMIDGERIAVSADLGPKLKGLEN